MLTEPTWGGQDCQDAHKSQDNSLVQKPQGLKNVFEYFIYNLTNLSLKKMDYPGTQFIILSVGSIQNQLFALGAANFFCKGPNSKYSRCFRQHCLCCSSSTLLLWYKNSHRRTNEWEWLCSEKTLFRMQSGKARFGPQCGCWAPSQVVVSLRGTRWEKVIKLKSTNTIWNICK